MQNSLIYKEGKIKANTLKLVNLSFLFLVFIFSISFSSAFDFPHTIVNIDFTGNLTNLSEMEDVNIPSPTNNQLLKFDSGTNKWVSATISGLTDTNASTACSGTQYLAGNGTCLSVSAIGGDTNETIRFNALVNSPCTGTDKMRGTQANGSTICATDETAAGGAAKKADGIYLYNDSLTIFFNETKAGTNLSVNSSDYWDGLGSFNTTQMEESSGLLSITISWFSSFFDDLFGGKDTDDLTEGSTNLYDNQSWNQTFADILYLGVDSGEPLWSANFTLYNESWSTTFNSTYDGYNSTGLIINWSSSGFTESDPFAYNGTLAFLSDILGFNYFNLTDFDIDDYYLLSNPFGYFNSTNPSPDTNETSFVTNLTATNCGGTDKVIGVQTNGTVLCDTDQTAAGGAAKKADDVYLYNDSLTIFFNDTLAGTNLSVNSSDYWDDFDTANTTWFENIAGALSLKLDQLTSFGDTVWCTLTGCTMTGNIDMGGNNILNGGLINSTNMTAVNGTFSNIYNRNEIDELVNAAVLELFFKNITSEISTYWVMNKTANDRPKNSSVQTISATDTELGGFVSKNASDLGISGLTNGIIDAHFHASVNSIGGTKVASGWYKIYRRNSTGTEFFLTSSHLVAVDSTIETEYEAHASLLEEVTLNESDRIVIRLFANLSGAGGDPILTTYIQGNTLARITFGTTGVNFATQRDLEDYVKIDGTRSMTANWNQGSFNLTNAASYFLGTAITSEQWVTNNSGTISGLNTTQLENSGGVINIVASWFSSFFDDLFGGKDTDDLTEGSTNLYDNKSWNQTFADTLYAEIGITEPLWSANLTAHNESWVSTFNSTYDALNSSGLIINWSILSTPASKVTAGTFGTGNYVMDTNLTIETIVFENDASHFITDNSTCVIITGDTSTLEVC